MLLWVLQSNLFREAGYIRLLEALDRFKCDRVFVKPVHFTDRLLPGDFDSPKAVNPDDVPEPEIDTSRPILAMGSYTLAKIARSRGWSPGAFLENTSYPEWRRGWGPERLLNPDAWVSPLHDVALTSPMFVRPVLDSKSFNGKVYEPDDFNEWRDSVMGLGPDATVNGGTEVLVTEPREIYTETRFFVIDGRIVTGSLYRSGGRVRYDEDVDPGALAFVKSCVRWWTPSRAFVVDVALTPEGYRVIEVNSINASGFYACDMQKLVVAFEEAFGE